MKLIACPSCHRQHNATGLDPASRIRCICDTVLTAGDARELTVRGLVCRHCGAPCGPDSLACSHCSAALSELDRKATLLCPSCGSRIPDASKFCHTCSIELRPQALAPLPEKSKCPRCEGILQLRILGEFDVIECTSCAGLWFDPKEFEAVCQRADVASIPSLNARMTEKELPRQPEDLQRYIRCIYCTQLMQRRAFRSRKGNSGVVIDRCPKHGIWLDDMELESIVAFLRTDPVLETDSQVDGQSKIPSLEGTKDMLGVPRPVGRRRRSRRDRKSNSPWDDVLEIVFWLTFWNWG